MAACRFFYDLLGPKQSIVSGRSVTEMSQFGPGYIYPLQKIDYGLGIWRTTMLSMKEDMLNATFPGLGSVYLFIFLKKPPKH